MSEQYRSKKYHDISELADETTKKIASSEKEWIKYLDTAGRMFRFPFHAQVLIYAQRPDATACATMEQWNQGMGCWVNRGSKGIALIDRTSPRPKLTYVFDVSNVHKAKYIGKDPYLWELREEHKETVAAQLEKIGGETDANMPFENRIMELADRMAREHMENLMKQADAVKAGSLLEHLDYHAIRIRMQETLSSSIAYTILSRCGADMGVWKEQLKFQYISDFDTVDTLSVIGNATVGICRPILIEIEKTIAAYDRQMEKNREKQKETKHSGNEEKKEKSLANTRNLVYNVSNNDAWKTKQAETPRQGIEREKTAYGTDIREARGLPDPKSDHTAGAGGRTDKIRTDARKIPERAYGRGLRGDDPERDADTASAAGSGAGRAEDGSVEE